MFRKLAFAVVIALLTPTLNASAASVDEFYHGKRITVVVGFGPGGGYDVYARLLARYVGKYIPGEPTVVVQNMPGAGSLQAANYLFNVAPKDGAVIGTFERNIPLMGLLGGNPAVRFDAQKFTWLGSLSQFSTDAMLIIVKSGSRFRSVDDLRRTDVAPLAVGGTARGAAASDLPILLRDILGLNIRLIQGYPDNNALLLAFERDEIEADTLALSSLQTGRPQWLQAERSIRALIQFGRTTRHPDFKDTPTARELATNDRSRALIEAVELPYLLSRPFAAPPGVPEDRAKALTAAFTAVQKDSNYVEDAKRAGLDVDGVDGEVVAKVLNEIGHQPRELLDDLKRKLTQD